MHGDHRVEQLGVHVVERLVAQDAGVVDDDVDGAERVDRALHDRLAALRCGDRIGVGDGFAARVLDLVDDVLGGPLVAAGAVDGAAEIVHHDQRAALGEHQRMLPAEPTTGAGDDRHFSVESEIGGISHGRGSYRRHPPGRKSAARLAPCPPPIIPAMSEPTEGWAVGSPQVQWPLVITYAAVRCDDESMAAVTDRHADAVEDGELASLVVEVDPQRRAVAAELERDAVPRFRQARRESR